MSEELPKVAVDIWSDVMCPWCVIGYKNLQRALETLDGEIGAEIRWLPFELNPDMPPEGEESRAHLDAKEGNQEEDDERLQADKRREAQDDPAREAGGELIVSGVGIQQFEERENLLQQ